MVVKYWSINPIYFIPPPTQPTVESYHIIQYILQGVPLPKMLLIPLYRFRNVTLTIIQSELRFLLECQLCQ